LPSAAELAKVLDSAGSQSQASRYVDRSQLEQIKEEAKEEREELRRQVQELTADVHALVKQLHAEGVGYRERVQREGHRGLGANARSAWRPNIEIAMRQPAHVSELGHESLAELAMQGNHNAHRERLLREIMCVDNCTWDEAHEVLADMDCEKEKWYWIESAPYRIGIAGALSGAIFGTLLVFCKPVALWYGINVAGEDLPDGVKDINEMTVNQVGTWTWSWMEPMIGTASFVLLCCQFTRAQVLKMNMKPYGEYMLQWRANRVADKYPQYDRSMVRAWAKHMPRAGITFIPVYERQVGFKGPTSGL